MQGGRRGRPAIVLGAAALAATWLAQVSIPLLHRGHRALPTLLVVAFLAVASGCFAAAAVGVPRAALAVGLACGVGLLAEVVGTRTGWPFGTYDYTSALRPQVLGVPLAVVLAWAGMGLPAVAVGRRLAQRPVAQVALGAVALAGWDLFLDPQMVREGYWTWPGGGAWRGVPLSNYVGWLGASAVLVALVGLVAPGLRSTPLVAAYALMAVMEALGFIAFFGDPLVGVVGGLVCLPLAAGALVRRPAPSPQQPVGAAA